MTIILKLKTNDKTMKTGMVTAPTAFDSESTKYII